MHQLRGPILVILLVAGCGLGRQPSTLDGRDFLSTSVTEDGEERPLVDETRIRLAFSDGQIGASAGCNAIGGTYRVEDGVLVFEGGGMTEMGCDPERHAQDEWLSAFLGSRPSIVVAGNEVTLTADGTVVELLDGEVAEPDLPLDGTTWTVDSIISGDAVSTVPGNAVATLVFDEDGGVEVNTGCNTGSGRYEASETELRFVDVAITRIACEGPAAELEAAVLPMLAAESVAYRIDASSLMLSAGDAGLGLQGA
jgi:heat shock protein HslJ